MRRRFHADIVEGGRAELRGDNAFHLVRVLRAAPGQIYEVAAAGRVFLARVSDVAPERVGFELIEELPAGEVALVVEAWPAIIKFNRYEWLIEKAVELGVAAIRPVISERTDAHLAHAAAARVERWRRIAHESAQQARRASVPEVTTPAPLAAVAELDSDALRIYLAERGEVPPLRDVLRTTPARRVCLLSGPEGGWTAGEIDLLNRSAWRSASLGPLILRAETAAIAALVAVAYEFTRARSAETR